LLLPLRVPRVHLLRAHRDPDQQAPAPFVGAAPQMSRPAQFRKQAGAEFRISDFGFEKDSALQLNVERRTLSVGRFLLSTPCNASLSASSFPNCARRNLTRTARSGI